MGGGEQAVRSMRTGQRRHARRSRKERSANRLAGKAGVGSVQDHRWRQHSINKAWRENLGGYPRVCWSGQHEWRSWLTNEGCKNGGGRQEQAALQTGSRRHGESPACCGALFLMCSMAIGAVPTAWDWARYEPAHLSDRLSSGAGTEIATVLRLRTRLYSPFSACLWFSLLSSEWKYTFNCGLCPAEGWAPPATCSWWPLSNWALVPQV